MKQQQSFFPVLIVLACVVLCAACAPSKVSGLFDPLPGDQLFARAEAAFSRQDYNEALTLYQAYLAEFPGGSHEPAALLRKADIRSLQNRFTESREGYEAVISRYPGSRYEAMAVIGILESWLRQKVFAAVIEQADRLDDRTAPESVIVRKYTLVAEAYLSMERPMDAAQVLIAALKKVGEASRKRMLVLFDQIVAAIDPEGVNSLLAGVRDPDYRGYLTCQLAGKYMALDEYEQAESVLSGFMEKFPDNPYTGQARNLSGRIAKESAYERYTIGCLLPLTGKYRRFGERALKGVQFAFQSFMAAYGTQNAPPVRLLVRDTGSDPQLALAAVKELAENRVAAIIGPLVFFEEAISEAQNRHIPIITLTQEPDVPAMGDWVFRNFLTPQMQTRALVSHARNVLCLDRFAVLYPDEPYGRVFAHAFWDHVEESGGQIVGFESYDPEETDFAGPIKKLVGLYYDVPEDLQETVDAQREFWARERGLWAEPESGMDAPEADHTTGGQPEEEEETAIVDFDALFIPDGPSNAGLIIPQLVYHDVVDVLFMGTNLWHSPELVNMAKKYVNGAILPTGFLETGGNPGVRLFSEGFESLFGEKPDFIAAVAYDTASLLFPIITDSGLRYRSSIKKRLGRLTGFPGVTGVTAFDATGEVHKRLPLLQIQGRQFVEIPPSAPSQKDL
ncbi:MAG: penicillin-binding protein activator [Thermodesulfobacteriota bacterium]|nr:penicillin-binding protein activator [Thermodesulfobacteriota bacterium]